MSSDGSFSPQASGVIGQLSNLMQQTLILPTMFFVLLTFTRNKIQDANIGKEYDYVIVGGGSAGAVLANRLSEEPGISVLLLEAGDDETPVGEIPMVAQYLQLSKYDWQYVTTPQEIGCQGQFDKVCRLPRGRVIGGSSSINYMVYCRGNHKDYDHWEKLGNPGWSFKDTLPYFKKSEDYRPPIIPGNEEYHSKGGYLTVSDQSWRSSLTEAFIESGKSMGYEEVDQNGRTQTGFAYIVNTIRDGARCSTAKAFLKGDQKNTRSRHVSLNSFVTKILIDPDRKIATGIEVVKNGETKKVRARKEVIISAGAINTPQLLMLSGIGDEDHLNEIGIKPILHLPGVGKNLQDHVSTHGVLFAINGSYALSLSRVIKGQYINQWAVKGDGPLSVPGGLQGQAFVSSPLIDSSKDWPDLQLKLLLGSVASDNGTQLRAMVNINDEVYNGYFRPMSDIDNFSIFPIVLRPKSTGNIKLKSANPYQKPEIDPRYFEDEEDLKVLVEGVKISIEIGENRAFDKFNSRFPLYPVPGCEEFPLRSDEYYACLVKYTTFTYYHYCCTSKMGNDSDPMAVVDHRLRVRGIDKLRIVDASIMPQITSGNTNAPVIMIAEKAADMIKEDNK